VCVIVSMECVFLKDLSSTSILWSYANHFVSMFAGAIECQEICCDGKKGDLFNIFVIKWRSN